MKRRILMLNYEFPPLGGGAGNATYYLLKEFSKNPDVEIDLVTSSTGKYKEYRFSDNITIYFLDIGKSPDWQNQSARELLTYSWKSFWKSHSLLRKKNYHLVHAFFGIPCGFIALLLNKPYLVSLRGMDVPFYSQKFHWLDILFFRWLSALIWKRAQIVIANSQGLCDLAYQSYAKKKIDIIPNGVDTEQFKPRSKQNNIFTVLTVARLIPRKGIQYLVEGFAKFTAKFSESKLIIVGDGPMKNQLQQKAVELRIDDRIEFPGNITHDKLPGIYQKADVFVLPSLNEGMSNSILEALASGLAIIATPTGGSSELIDKDNGIIIEPKNAQAITSALENCLGNQNKLAKMKINSREKSELYSWRRVAEKYYSVYKKVCAE
ncbi:MAG: glycosyltransferase family 4 protein [Patescibacteria group bacterium]|nr:glycosyltransferase family 4 protein [Patescibacteria group bacterium]